MHTDGQGTQYPITSQSAVGSPMPIFGQVASLDLVAGVQSMSPSIWVRHSALGLRREEMEVLVRLRVCSESSDSRPSRTAGTGNQAVGSRQAGGTARPGVRMPATRPPQWTRRRRTRNKRMRAPMWRGRCGACRPTPSCCSCCATRLIAQTHGAAAAARAPADEVLMRWPRRVYEPSIEQVPPLVQPL